MTMRPKNKISKISYQKKDMRLGVMKRCTLHAYCTYIILTFSYSSPNEITFGPHEPNQFTVIPAEVQILIFLIHDSFHVNTLSVACF